MWSCLLALALTQTQSNVLATIDLRGLDGASKSVQVQPVAHRDPPDDYAKRTASRLA